MCTCLPVAGVKPTSASGSPRRVAVAPGLVTRNPFSEIRTCATLEPNDLRYIP